MSIEKDDKKKVLEFWLDIEAQVLKCVHKKINIFMEIAKDAQHTQTHYIDLWTHLWQKFMLRILHLHATSDVN